VKESAVSPKEIEMAIKRRSAFDLDPVKHTYKKEKI
jgi:hypothetical protein